MKIKSKTEHSPTEVRTKRQCTTTLNAWIMAAVECAHSILQAILEKHSTDCQVKKEQKQKKTWYLVYLFFLFHFFKKQKEEKPTLMDTSGVQELWGTSEPASKLTYSETAAYQQ